MKKQSRKRRDSGVLIFILLIATLTYWHNFAVASRTKGRDFDYAAWQTLTKSSNLFSDVHTKDFFISEHQNDAYETNAGSLYYNTGIRLAQLYNSVNIWPNYIGCTISSGCTLPDVRKRAVQTLPNLERGAFVKTDRSKQQVFDWVGINTKPGALTFSKIWDFDEYPITDSTMIAYLAPYDEKQPTASIQLKKLKFVTISKYNAPILHPVLNGYCLVHLTNDVGAITSGHGLRINYWGPPPLDQQGKPLPDFLDIRSMGVGTC